MQKFYRYATLATIVATMLLGLLAWPGLTTEAGVSSANLAITGTAVATFTVEPQSVIYLPMVIKPTAQVNDLKIVQFEFERRDEFVEIKNNGPGNQLMDGWQIFSVVGTQTFDFPSGITLAAGHTLRVHSGPDAVKNIPNDLRWTTAYIWNNKGDKAELKDSQGVVRDTSCYRNGCP